MTQAINRRLVTAVLVLAAFAAADEPATVPATVGVAFERDTIEPQIVEGFANTDTGRPVEAKDPMRIASISKLVFAPLAKAVLR